MKSEEIQLENSMGTGYVLPLGPVTLVWVVARRGLVGCGAFDVAALGRFGYPAARVRPACGDSVSRTPGRPCLGGDQGDECPCPEDGDIERDERKGST